MVDIIIRAKDGHELTERCVQSIIDHTPKDSYRIILVDDGSAPPYDFDVDFLVRHKRALGAVSATNSGLAISLQQDGDYVIVMDNDTEVPEGDTDWLRRFVAELEEYPDTGAVGATTNYANPPQHILYSPKTYTANWHDEKSSGVKDNPESVAFVSFCVLMRKSVMREVGFWDTRYNPGNWEDTDYAAQMRVAGYRVRVARSVYIHHVGHSTFGDEVKQLDETNMVRFIEKWGPGRLMDLGFVDPQDLLPASFFDGLKRRVGEPRSQS